jgi:DNA (cytosine-5)-methyltransferase 1
MATIFDLFCGTGGFSYGFEQADARYKTQFGTDLLPIAIQTFLANHKNTVGMAQDIRTIRRKVLSEKLNIRPGEVDVIIGGPPCQGFSSIRPFRSSKEDDPRNNLFEEFASFINFFRPKIFVIENVVGLATYKDGATVNAMEECFHSLGYDTEWRILNSAHFGVPQKRERFIMIGAERGTKITFPTPTHFSESPTIGYRNRHKVLAPQSRDLFSEQIEIAPAITVMDAISDLPEVLAGDEVTKYLHEPKNTYQSQRRNGAINLALHAATAHSKKMLEIIGYSGKNINSIPSHLISSGFSSSYSRLCGDEPAVTITVNFVHPASNRCIHPVQHRALTPREGARIQSFDDTYAFAGTKTQVTKQIGNAVPPLLGKAIGASVSKMLF